MRCILYSFQHYSHVKLELLLLYLFVRIKKLRSYRVPRQTMYKLFLKYLQRLVPLSSCLRLFIKIVLCFYLLKCSFFKIFFFFFILNLFKIPSYLSRTLLVHVTTFGKNLSRSIGGLMKNILLTTQFRERTGVAFFN